MQSEIVEKLRGELGTGVDTEAKVVYIMIEIRKFLEQPESKGGFEVLRMFCNWVAHPSLTHYGKGSLLEDLDATLAESLSDEGLQARYNFLSFENLKGQLKQFLLANGLPYNLIDDGKSWAELLRLYTSVVSECPLVYRQEAFPQKPMKEASPSKHLKSVKLTVRELEKVANELKNQHTVVWRWELTLNDESKRGFFNSFTYAC